MPKKKDSELEKIISDKTSGSSELLLDLHEHLKGQKVFLELFPDFVENIKNKFPSFQNIQTYLNNLQAELNRNKKLDLFFKKYDSLLQNQYDRIFEISKSYLLKYKKFITISNSKTVFEIIKKLHHHAKGIEVIVCESQPKCEGRILAKYFSESGITTTLITEAMLAQKVNECDAAIIGADSILKNKNAVNKVGSLTLAVLCKYYKKPFFVVADGKKRSSKTKLSQKEMPPEEIWRHHSNKIKINNFYFEQIDRKLITKIFNS